MSGPLAQPIPLEERRYGIRVGRIADVSLVLDAAVVLVVKAHIPPEVLRRTLPSQVTISPVERLGASLDGLVPSIGIAAMGEQARGVPDGDGACHFELNGRRTFWEAASRSGGFAIYVSADISGLEMTCWAVKR